MLIAQLSDPHVCAPGVLYKGVADSNRMLQQAIDHLHALDRQPDLVVVTGDLVADGHPHEYAVAVRLLDTLRAPYLVIPGNHDDRDQLRAAFRHHDYLPRQGAVHYCVDRYPMRIVALDCCVEGQHHGEVDAQGLRWLEAALSANRGQPTLLLMHHPPFVSGIPYLDQYRLLEPDRLEAIVASAPNIEAVLVGHVHRGMIHRWGGSVVYSCPSTTTEIALRLQPGAKPQSFMGPPACMLHLWSDEHGLVSHTSYIGPYPGPYDFF